MPSTAALTVAMLPASLTTIDEQAFYNCTHLTFVSMPGNTAIGSNAFNGESTALYAPIQNLVMGNATPAAYAGQVGNAANANLYVPRGSKTAYEEAGWTAFKSIIETDMAGGGKKGDVNGDGEVTISDVVGIVDLILDGQ